MKAILWFIRTFYSIEKTMLIARHIDQILDDKLNDEIRRESV